LYVLLLCPMEYMKDIYRKRTQ